MARDEMDGSGDLGAPNGPEKDPCPDVKFIGAKNHEKLKGVDTKSGRSAKAKLRAQELQHAAAASRDEEDDSDEEDAKNCCIEFQEMVCSCEKCTVYAREACSLSNLKKRVPIVSWIPKYRLPELQGDIVAGLTVGLMVIPQGLAYAVVANLPPQYGLYSAFMGCFVYTVFGTSKDITLGPTAIMSLMTASFAVSPKDGDATYAIILALFTGIIQVVMGLLHLGFLVRYISHPVINAFTSAAAITIAVGQIKNILGLKKIPSEFLHLVYETCAKVPQTNVWDMTMGICCLIILTFMKYMRDFKCCKRCFSNSENNRFSAALKYTIWLLSISRNAIVVIVAAVVSFILIASGKNVLSVCGSLKAGLPDIRVPDFQVTNVTGNVTTVIADTATIFSNIGAGFFIVPILGLVETIAIGKAFARKNNYKIKASQELIAMGLANVIGSFVQSYPVTGSFSRTAVNSQSGVRTPAGGVFTGITVLLALGLLTPWFYYIPNSALAAVIITAVLQMIDVHIIKRLWVVNKIDLIPWGICFILSFVLGIEYGILIGIGVSLVILLIPQSRPGVIVVDRDIVVIQLDRGLQFPGLEFLAARIQRYALTDTGAKSVVIDFTHISILDYSVIQGLQELCDEMKARNVLLILACVKPDLLDKILKAEISYLKHASTVDDALKLIYDQDDEASVHEVTPLAPTTFDEPNNHEIVVSGRQEQTECLLQS